jgi:hypothetical protein
MIKYQSVQGYTDLSGLSLPQDPLTFIREYPTDYILLRLSKVNAYLFQRESGKEVDMLILKEAVFEGLTDYIPELDSFQAILSEEKRLFSAHSIALLISSCLDNFVEADREQVVDTLRFARNLFKTITVFNQLYFSRFNGDEFGSFKGLFKMESMQQGHLRTNVPLKLITLMKFAFISKFMADHPALKEYSVAYFTKMGLGNPWLFGKFFLEVLTNATAGINSGKHILNVDGLPLQLIREFAIDRDSFAGKKGLSLNMDIVPKPFYFIDGDALILDYSFFQYAIEQGFFFSFYQNSLKGTKAFKNYNSFQSYIGLRYFEKFLVEKYLHAIFYRKDQQVISSEKYQDFIVKASPTDIFIFEVKMTSLHVKTLEDMDFDKFREFLYNNFLAERATDGKSKGIHQLVKQVGHLGNEDGALLASLGLKSAKKLNIYPVIICSDINVNISGVNDYLNQAFAPLIAEWRPTFQSIRPLTMMHVDVLVEYFGTLKKNKSALAGLVSSYFKNVDGLERLYKNDGFLQDYFLSKRSFSAYLYAKNLKGLLQETVDEMGRSFDLEIKDFGQ